MSEFKLADTMEIPVKDAKSIIDKFFKAVPKVEKFLRGLGELGKKRGFIKTSKPYGRIRWFEKWDYAVEQDDFKIMGEIERASKNSPIQGKFVPWLNSVNSVKAEMLIPSQALW
jgi:DNA polymerase I-like protein with 3'-5' exonuclease and polymerase domains